MDLTSFVTVERAHADKRVCHLPLAPCALQRNFMHKNKYISTTKPRIITSLMNFSNKSVLTNRQLLRFTDDCLNPAVACVHQRSPFRFGPLAVLYSTVRTVTNTYFRYRTIFQHHIISFHCAPASSGVHNDNCKIFRQRRLRAI